MSSRWINGLSRRLIPDANRPVLASGGQGFAIWRKGEAVNRAPMATKLSIFFSARHVPEPDDSVATSRGEGAPVRRKSDGINPILMFEVLQFLCRARVPQRDDPGPK